MERGELDPLRRGVRDGYAFLSQQEVNEPFVDEAISTSLRRADYDLAPRNFVRAHEA